MLGQRHSRARKVSLSASLLALLVLLIGVMNILSALSWIDPARIHWLRENLPLELHTGSRTLTVASGLFLILLSWSLYRRKRQGWLLACLLLASSVVLHLGKGLDYEEASISAVILGLLIAFRSRFAVRSEPLGWLGALGTLAALGTACLAYGAIGFMALHRHFSPAPNWGSAWQSSLALCTQLFDPVLRPIHGHRDAFWLMDSVVVAAGLTVLYAFYLLVQPVSRALFGAAREQEELRNLLARSGGPPLAAWAMASGFSYHFSPTRDAAIAYKVSGGVAAALTDPLGSLEGAAAALESFSALCRTNDWLPAFCQVRPALLMAYESQGWQALKSGEEALLDLVNLEFRGKDWQDVRTALSRLPREGYSAVWYELAADPLGWRDALRRISLEWVKRHGGREMGFSLGSWNFLERSALPQRLLVLAAPDGTPAGFMSFVPLYCAGGGYALDLMRRSEQVPPGAMEFLLATAIRQFQAEGLARLSLGTAPLADSSAVPGGPLDKARALLFEHFGSVYNFKGLKAFKQKFQPHWEPRYLIYPGLASLPRVLLALLALHNEPGKDSGRPLPETRGSAPSN